MIELSEELKAVKEKGFSKSHWLEIVIEKAESLETELIEERKKHESQIQKMKSCYIELSNSVEFADNGEAAYIANYALMKRFDMAFDVSNWKLKQSENDDIN